MISTKNIIIDLKDVPTAWPFEYYLGISERLDGQDVKLTSVFNKAEKDPSMFVYFDVNKGRYRFKDFSSGHYGDCLELVKALFNLKDRRESSSKLLSDYNEYVIDNGVRPTLAFKTYSRFKVTDYEIRHWTTLDKTYWTKFKIGSKLLEKYNVAPLEFYKMQKKNDEGIVEKEITIDGSRHIYGYFKDDGTLYKVYQPLSHKKKFIKVQNYVQGSDQLKYDKKYLVITSSLKDLMAFSRLNLGNTEAIAPDSENSLIPESLLKDITSKYKKVFVLFDNDEPGIKSMKKYKERYGFDYVLLDMEKDLSDSVKKYGLVKTRETLLPLLKRLCI